ncbi:sigma-70 family RNA polymerase sigma factor [Rhizobium rhizogenes]|uniref:sigma-70 family RNA polymerase sigma factor n=1 Tax=Rhizobium rhizogenes TaxID=359 RepID=UPI0015741B34|nr:sigma-70 family RNA polymerase sigma factor [Rhizobium rhizogenes]NTF42985.1 sigma-70 family RNA polymerase sigma factor [Rhizobium rhizogenes]
MDERNWQAEKFGANRPHLRAVAYRMLGSRTEAEDAVQEAWLRLLKTDTSKIENLGGWLTTVTARICLDWLRARKSRREEPLTAHVPEPAVTHDAGNGTDPEQDALLADSVGLALLVVLQRLNPAERLAFVLHDMFDMPFDDIAPIVERSVVATRQLASRARRRVQETPVAIEADLTRQWHVVDAFLTASRGGDMQALLAVLDPKIVFRPDAVAALMGSVSDIQGRAAIAEAFRGRAQAAQPAVIDGAIGAVVILGGQLRIALRFTIAANGMITAVDALADPEELRKLDVVMIEP